VIQKPRNPGVRGARPTHLDAQGERSVAFLHESPERTATSEGGKRGGGFIALPDQLKPTNKTLNGGGAEKLIWFLFCWGGLFFGNVQIFPGRCLSMAFEKGGARLTSDLSRARAGAVSSLGGGGGGKRGSRFLGGPFPGGPGRGKGRYRLPPGRGGGEGGGLYGGRGGDRGRKGDQRKDRALYPLTVHGFLGAFTGGEVESHVFLGRRGGRNISARGAGEWGRQKNHCPKKGGGGRGGGGGGGPRRKNSIPPWGVGRKGGGPGAGFFFVVENGVF